MWYVYFKRKSVLLIRYLLLPHPPDSGGGEEGAGGGLQQEGGGDAGDCAGEAWRDWGSCTPLGRVWTTDRDTCCSCGLCSLAYRECLPTSQPLVWVHAAVRSLLDGWVALSFNDSHFYVIFIPSSLFPVPSGKHCSLARRTKAAESPRLPCLLPDWVHHHDGVLATALPGVDPTARLALPSTSPWGTGQCSALCASTNS